jgi:hypothetical protein
MTPKTRLQKKAARIDKTDAERAFDADIGKARNELDRTLAKIGEDFRDALKRLNEDRAAARKEAHDKYDDERVKIVKKHAAAEAKAA